MSKCWQRESNDMRVAFAFPSAEYPAICGVPMNTLFNKVRLISGSFSHTSMTASEINPFSRASNKAFVSITSPREVLMMMGERFSERKNDWSARWRVLYFPSLYKGTWNVRTSHFSARNCRELKPALPSSSSRGKSFSNTRMPSSRATSATLLPTLPTPTMPIAISDSFFPFRSSVSKSVDCRYWATDAELQPGAFFHTMPA